MLLQNATTGLASVVYGAGLLTADIRSDGQALLSGQTPWRWARNWFGPSDPAAWMSQIAARKQALVALLARTDAGQLLNGSLNFGQLFAPKVALNALRQQTARQTGKAIDSLKLVASWDPALIAAAPLKLTLDGFLLQGAGFQGGVLSPLAPDSPSLVRLPSCQVAYVPKEDGFEAYPDPQSALAVPVYVAVSREEYVCELRVPCKGQLDRWVLAGTALFLNSF
jgi:dynein heavy chain 2